MSTEEQWRKIPGVPSHYEVSSLGRIKSLDKYVPSGHKSGGLRFSRGRILKPGIASSGYYTFNCLPIPSGCKSPTVLVHRAVGTAFIPNPENKPEINHRDGNKKNNLVENLEWATRRENGKHMFNEVYHFNVQGENCRGPRKLNAVDVLAIRAAEGIETPAALAHRYSVSAYHIGQIHRRLRWAHS